jgi:MFS family permease
MKAGGHAGAGRPAAEKLRRALWCANVNAALWATGNGLVSTLLVIYLAVDLGAQGVAISFILASPRFAGLLRLAVPALVARWHHRKEVCLATFFLSAFVLCVVPLVSAAGQIVSSQLALVILVIAWCAYHLLEYVGAVALWSWLGDLTPPSVRGRLLGHRERWLVAGRVAGIIGSASLAVLWEWWLPVADRWQPMALSAIAGAVCMFAAVVPLWYMPAASYAPSAVPNAPWRTLGKAILDPAYRRLVVFSCAFSIVNGVPAAAQELYPIRVLGMSYAGMQSLRGMMRVGQSSIAPSVGRLCDRWGNRPVMIIAQLIVATSSLFYLAATPERWWLLIGAHVAWIAYVGLNVGLDNIKLKLAPSDNNAPYVALYQALSDLSHGVTILVGGALIDEHLRAGGTAAIRLFGEVFLLAWIARTLVVILLVRLIEPNARSLHEILGKRS